MGVSCNENIYLDAAKDVLNGNNSPAINDAPKISDVSDQTIAEGGNTGALAVTINDSDDTLNCATSLSMTTSNATLINNSDVVFAGTIPNCTATLTPNSNESGASTITLTVTDGTTTNTDTFLLTVTAAPAGPPSLAPGEEWVEAF